MARYVRKVAINVAERKYIDYPLLQFTIGNTANAFCISLLNGIPQGTTAADASTRIGNKIYIRAIQLNFNIYGTVLMAAGGGSCRLVVVNNREGAKNMVAHSELFVGAQVPSARNTPYLAKYAVKLDKVHSLATYSGTPGTSATTGPQGLGSITIPINRNYSYVSATIAGGTTNYGTPLVMAVPNYLLAVTNMLKDDLQLLIESDVSNCCNINLGIKVIWSDA